MAAGSAAALRRCGCGALILVMAIARVTLVFASLLVVFAISGREAQAQYGQTWLIEVNYPPNGIQEAAVNGCYPCGGSGQIHFPWGTGTGQFQLDSTYSQITYNFVIPSPFAPGGTCPNGAPVSGTIPITVGGGPFPATVTYSASGAIYTNAGNVADTCLGVLPQQSITLTATSSVSGTDMEGGGLGSGETYPRVYRQNAPVQTLIGSSTGPYSLQPGDTVHTGSFTFAMEMLYFNVFGLPGAGLNANLGANTVWTLTTTPTYAPFGGVLQQGTAEIYFNGETAFPLNCQGRSDCVEVSNPAGYVVIHTSTLTNCPVNQRCVDVTVTTNAIVNPAEAAANSPSQITMTVTVNAGAVDIIDNTGNRTTLAVGSSVTLTAPVSAYYAQTGQLRTVDGMAPVDEVTGAIDKLLGHKVRA